jgi:phenylacetate-CoA ligase
LEDFADKIPVVTKDMLRRDQAEHPPFGSYLGVDPGEVFRIYGSSGTTGTPTLYGISKDDWKHAEDAQAMAVWAMGIRPSDRVHFGFPFSMFIGGWAIMAGCERVGATTFPIGAADSRRHIDLLSQLDSTVFAGTPSYVLHLAEVAQEIGTDLRETALHTVMVGGEPGGTLNGVRNAILEAFGRLHVVDTGNTSECFPTQMNSSCSDESGVHVFEDEVYLEIVDPTNPHSLVAEGTHGATVYTTLWRRSQPMIRFWAGDETYMVRERCSCGRTYPRLPEGLLGRIDDMLLIRGANVYPSAIENTLRPIPGVGREYRIIVEKRGALDELMIETEYDAQSLSGEWDLDGAKRRLAEEIAAQLRRTIGLRCFISVVEPGTFEPMIFKARRVIDKRAKLA